MFQKKITKFSTEVKTKEININLLENRINSFENFIIVNDKKNKKFKVYDRKCDHAGGKILSFKNTHKCPYHNWIFNPITGKYSNAIKKKELNFELRKNNLVIKDKIITPILNSESSNKSIKIKYLNHAFIIIESDRFKFALDPWALGPAFGTGWWLAKNTETNWVEEVNNCDFVFISHNHPDHLHSLTLSLIKKKTNFLIPNFKTKSVQKCLKKIGFKNFFCLDFLQEFNLINTDLNLMILKSGDFRDDSGLYFSTGGTNFLFGVDSNNLNSLVLPKVDIFASSYAAGASGFPLIFDNYNIKEKRKILDYNKKFLLSVRLKEIKLCKTKYFLPYAGSFNIKLIRDKFIKNNNLKNKIDDFNIIEKNGVKLLDINKFNQFEFLNGKLISNILVKSRKFQDIKPKKYLDAVKNDFKKISIKYIRSYFVNSNFKDNLKLYVSLTDDNFKISKLDFSVNFSKKNILFSIEKNGIKKKNLINENKINNIRVIFIKARIESFMELVLNKNPWENLSIGFQCRIYRVPNQYNADFWFHFSNKYIKLEKARQFDQCNNCEILSQNLQNELLLQGII